MPLLDVRRQVEQATGRRAVEGLGVVVAPHGECRARVARRLPPAVLTAPVAVRVRPVVQLEVVDDDGAPL